MEVRDLYRANIYYSFLVQLAFSVLVDSSFSTQAPTHIVIPISPAVSMDLDLQTFSLYLVKLCITSSICLSSALPILRPTKCTLIIQKLVLSA